jgi:ATP-dependent DNA helicase RecG
LEDKQNKNKDNKQEIKKFNQFASQIQFLKGIGPKRAEILAEIGILTVEDLLKYYPKSYIDITAAQSLRELKKIFSGNNFINLDKEVNFDALLKNQYTVLAKISSKIERNIGYKRQILIVNIADGSGGSAKITFWNKIHFYNKSLIEGQLIAVTGRVEFDGFGLNFTHPDITVIEDEEAGLYRQGRILPKYIQPESFQRVGLTNNTLRKLIGEILESKKYHIDETLSNEVINNQNLPKISQTLEYIHFPQDKITLNKATLRVKFEEIFFYELSLILQRTKLKNYEKGLVINPKSITARTVYESLPFELTKDQKKVLNEIAADMKSGKPMNRLLQGDVGSGKTIVATLSMLMVCENGYQTLIMAPTEILAEQHFSGISKLLKNTDIKVIKLLGGMKGKEKKESLEEILNGNANIIIGTHALFQATVKFKKLGLIIIDEQHRFGVQQRADLVKLAKDSLENLAAPHILVMSATPIPRTLNLTYYGDLDVSVIKTKPAERKEIITKVKFESQTKEVFEFIKDKIHEGRQAFLVYPLVDKSDKMEMLKSATEHHELLSNEIFSEFKLGLVHGQMTWKEKEEVMLDFYNKKYDILIATTVIEVGIDVPNASVIVIENADRFGLSQLHQLRGRVGRGSEQSYCFLITKDEFRIKVGGIEQNEIEKKAAIIRLKTMAKTNDGFEISEVDIKLRGPGDILGVKQSGLPNFKYIDLVEDVEIIKTARDQAIEILDYDPKLNKPQNLILKQNLIKLGYAKNSYLDIA